MTILNLKKYKNIYFSIDKQYIYLLSFFQLNTELLIQSGEGTGPMMPSNLNDFSSFNGANSSRYKT